MTTYTIDGQRLSTREEGPPGAQLALLIHGWSSSWYAMSPLLESLSSRYACIAVDLPGYGRSPQLREPLTIAAYVDLLAELIVRISDQPVVLVGHSMGGMIAMTLALEYPELVDSLVLLAPTVTGRLSRFVNAIYSPLNVLERTRAGAAFVARIERHSRSLTDRLLRPASFAAKTEIAPTDYLRLKADARRPDRGRVRADSFRAMRANDLTSRIGQLQTPALVLAGAEDNTVPLRDAGIIAREWPAADLRIMPNVGHWPQFEQRDMTLRYIAAFLGLPLSHGAADVTMLTPPSVGQLAHFLTNSDLGRGMSQAQRSRLAAQMSLRVVEGHGLVANLEESGEELFVVQRGALEVWLRPPCDERGLPLATLLPGEIAGELALLDGGPRSAWLRAGPQGATLLCLARDRLEALRNDDAELSSQLLWNISTGLARRLRQARTQELTVGEMAA